MICVAVGHHSRLEIHSMCNFLKLNDAKLVMKIEDLFSNFVSMQIISRYYWKVLLLMQNLHLIVRALVGRGAYTYLKRWLMYFAILNYENQPKRILKSLIVNFALSLYDLIWNILIAEWSIGTINLPEPPPDLPGQFCQNGDIDAVKILKRFKTYSPDKCKNIMRLNSMLK